LSINIALHHEISGEATAATPLARHYLLVDRQCIIAAVKSAGFLASRAAAGIVGP
jgi:hypothetical protein